MAGLWRAEGVLGTLGIRPRATLRDRVRRVRANLLLALQAGLAAGLAWFVAHDLIGHPAPFFAPVAAVITLAVSVGQRLRRAVELVAGVALGIGIGDGLIAWIGTGPVQVAVVVALAIAVAIFLGTGSALITQAAVSAVLVATLAPPGAGLDFPRFVDALIGGAVGLVVMAILLPTRPLSLVSRATRPVLDLLADGLSEVAAALTGRDAARARAVLTRLRAGERDLRRFEEALTAGREAASVTPLWWRSRGALAQYVESGSHVGYALRNTRVLVRRSIRVVAEREPVPDGLPRAVATLGEAVRCLERELDAGAEPTTTRERALTAVVYAADAYHSGVGFSGSVMVAQVRSAAIDLLRATGVPHDRAEELVQRAAGERDPRG